MLKQRIITAIVLAALLLGALFSLSAQGFALAIALVVVIASWEWANLAGFTAQWQRLLYAAVMAVAVAASAGFTGFIETGQLHQDNTRTILLAGCTWWAVALLWVQGYPASSVLWGRLLLKALMGFLVLVPAWLAMVYLRAQNYGEWLILLVVLIVAAADIGAYFSGKAFGRHKLAPDVSPGKSWEGFWGGFASCLLLAVVVGFGFGGGWMTLLLIAPAALASVLGDLLESMVKRQRGIKDSSQLLPGHGGVLDRVDSITAAAPFFALAVLLSGWKF